MQNDDLIITASTKRQKEEELAYLKTVKRAENTAAIKKAREYGDLSENFEYHAAKQSQAINNGRIADLEALLDRATIVEDSAVGGDIVGLGSLVVVRDLETEDDWTLTIVDMSSADPDMDRISYTSPVGSALMQKTVGDVVEVTIPDGKAKYKIMELGHG